MGEWVAVLNGSLGGLRWRVLSVVGARRLLPVVSVPSDVWCVRGAKMSMLGAHGVQSGIIGTSVLVKFFSFWAVGGGD